MFLSVEWAKRWLPSVFLLLSLFLPWWTMIDLYVIGWRTGETYYYPPFKSFTLSFLWADETMHAYSEVGLGAWYDVKPFNIPFLFFAFSLILLGGLCGLSNERRTRTLGGLLGIGSVVFYFIWRLVFPPWWGLMGIDFYFGIGVYQRGISLPSYIGAVWFLSIGFYLAIIGSLMLLVLSIRSSTETLKELIFSIIRWLRRRLPAVFLLLSLFLPWWTMIHILEPGYSLYFYLSFPWNPDVTFSVNRFQLEGSLYASFYDIPSFCFVSALILAGGLCGFSNKKKTQSLGGLLAILGVFSYFTLLFHKNYPLSLIEIENPYFGAKLYGHSFGHPFFGVNSIIIWFLSIGFYLALAGSLMLLSPLIRTLIERLRKRLQSSQLQPNILSEENSETQER